MKKRSLGNIILLSIITLGLYEIYWLASTRNEMVEKYRVKIPSAYYMIVVKGLQFIGAIVVIALILFVIPSQQKKVNLASSNIQKPSANCLPDYAVNTECKNQIDRYYNQPTNNAPYLYTVALLIVITMIVLEAFYITRWLWPYAKGVGKITNRWSRGTAIMLTIPGILLPTAIKDVYPILIIQNAFNRM